jgi:SAM-dependent methyltransferase
MRGDLERVACDNCRYDDIKLLFIKNGFNIVKCNNCGLVYTNPRISPESAPDIYDENYFKSPDSLITGYDNYVKERPTIEATFKKRMGFIFNNSPSLATAKSPRLLDIGCATGFLLNLFRELGWDVQGIELSAFALSYAVSELRLPVHHGSVGSVNLSEGVYDLITSWDVIEHSYTPKADLIKIHRLLRSGGYLAIITPNRDSWHARLLGHKWVEYEKPEEHLYFFGKRTFSQILNEIGFEVVATTTAGKYVSVSFLLNRLKSYSKMFELIGGMLRGNVSIKVLYINPYDKMFLLAKKR